MNIKMTSDIAGDRIWSIQGCRGIAALIIVCYHYYRDRGIFKNGYLMVDFFILSGFFWLMSANRSRNVNEEGQGGYFIKAIRKYFFPVAVYYMVMLALLLVKGLTGGFGDQSLMKQITHFPYEIIFSHLIGVNSDVYIASYIWYLPVMVFLLTFISSMYKWNKELTLFVFAPIAVVGGYTYLLNHWGDFTDFRSVGGVFIKGVYRGCADICVGILLAHNIKPISELFSCLRTWVIILLEVAVVAVSAYCIFLSNDGFSDILIVPAMCILIILCTSYRGIIHRFM